MEEGIADERAAHFNGYAEIPTYTCYKLGSFLCEPVVEATNFAGEAVEAEYDSGKYAYKVDFGGDSELQEGVEEFAVQAVMDLWGIGQVLSGRFRAADRYQEESERMV